MAAGLAVLPLGFHQVVETGESVAIKKVFQADGERWIKHFDSSVFEHQSGVPQIFVSSSRLWFQIL